MNRYRHVIEAVHQRKPKTIVDIGVHNGRRSAQIIKAAQSHRADIQYWGFDLWDELSEEQYQSEFFAPKKISSYEEAATNIYGAIPPAQAVLVKGDTRRTLRTGLLPDVIDFAWIDGGHSLETIRLDWESIEPRLGRHSVVLLDDYWHGRVDAGAKALTDAFDRRRFEIDLLGLDEINGLRISIAKVRPRGIDTRSSSRLLFANPRADEHGTA